MGKTKEEKKKEILDFLEYSVKGDKWFDLDKDNIVEKFIDEDFDEEDISKIIDELEKDKRIVEDKLSLNIIYPKRFKDKIKNKIGHFISSSFIRTIAIGLLPLVFLFSNENVYNWFMSYNNMTPQISFVYALFIGLFGSIIVGEILLWIWNKIIDNIPTVKEHKSYIYSIFLLIVIIGVIIYIWSIVSSQKIETIHILTILSISIIGGIALVSGKKWKKKSN